MPIISINVINRQTVALPELGEYPLVYMDEWDADTNDLGLVSSVGNKGETYKVSVAGTTELDGNAEWNVGDYVTFNGQVWDRLIGGVALTAANISDATEAGRAMLMAASAAAQLALLPVSDYIKKNVTAQLSVGMTVTAVPLGTLTSFTPNIALGNTQYGTNNGAFTISAPTSDGNVDIWITNGAAAGAIAFSGFTSPSGGGGDTYSTTNGQKFICMIKRCNGVSTYAFKALQ